MGENTQSISKNGLGAPSVPGKTKLAAKHDVVVNPFVDISQKITEVFRSYKTLSDNFRPIKTDGLD